MEKGSPQTGGSLHRASSRGSCQYHREKPGATAITRSHTSTPAQSGRHAEDKVGARGKGLDMPSRDELEPGWRLGRYRRRTHRGSPSHTYTTRTHASPRSPVQPDRSDSAPPRPLVPLGLPPGGLLPRWGSTAGSLATAPGAGSAWGRGYTRAGPQQLGRGWPRREELEQSAGQRQAWPSPESCPVLQPWAGTGKQVYLPSRPTGRARAGYLVPSSPGNTTGAQELRTLSV